MAKKMLIDATHAEETRVVVVDGNKVEEFDFESENKRQLAGSIYLAKVTRVEPSLQAAFVDYGGNRHGFLAFSEIHPDYYQIPQADRDALLAEELAYAKAQEEEEEKPKRTRRRRSRSRSKAEATTSDDAIATSDIVEVDAVEVDAVEVDAETGQAEAPTEAVDPVVVVDADVSVSGMDVVEPDASEADALISDDGPAAKEDAAVGDAQAPVSEEADKAVSETSEAAPVEALDDEVAPVNADAANEDEDDANDESADDEVAEEARPRRKPRPRRYKIQEVIKVRQILLIQVVKEERGNKGAALTTYLSLAGRYCVLMPNTARGGGISRKITNVADRKKLKDIAGDMNVPQGAGLIVRTAGAQRSGTEIIRDYEYLKRMWEQIRELTLKSIAPAKVYEEGDLIKRSIRDLYSNEIDEVIVEGDAGFKIAQDFMAMIMPTHAKNVTNYKENLPLFARFQVESYLGSMFNPTVQLKSGGYIVIDVTEALVAVDVNSGRATKEGSIEDTAFKTNMEAAEEVARQARLRDLAGLIVIDFIDMEERRNNTAVEKRLKDKLKTDRARIQVGRISSFGLLEMSRQRLRPGMLEATTQPCHHCHGTGLIRSDDNMALTILRQLEEEGTRRRSREVLLKAPIAIVNYLFNMKREAIAQIEARYGMAVRMEADPHLVSPDFSIEKFKTATRVIAEPSAPVVSASADFMDVPAEPVEAEVEEAVITPGSEEGEDQPKKRRRRRRRRRKSGDYVEGQEGEQGDETSSEKPQEQAQDAAAVSSDDAASDVTASEDVLADETAEKPKRKRTRRSRSRKSSEVAIEADAQSETAAQTSSEVKVEEIAEPVEKPKRTRTRRKKSEASSEDVKPESVAETVAVEEPAVEEPAVEEKPKRTRTRRKKAETETPVEASVAAAEVFLPAEAPAVADPAAEVKVEAPKVELAPAPVEVPMPVEAPVEVPAPIEVPASVEVAPQPAVEPESPAKKPKRGWWSIGK
jgi:ribonuclease E